LNEKEKALLQEAATGETPRLCLQTKTRIDTGCWWRRTPVWLCVMSETVIVLAVARRRYVQRVPLAACAGSYYCHATGELVLAPVESLEIRQLALSPSEALQALAALGGAQGREQAKE
jgi:hypothetical protein